MSALAQHVRIPLWNDCPPGSEGLNLVEQSEERSPDVAAFRDRAITAIGAPALTAFLPEKPNGTSVVLAPGGGYIRVVWDKEGVEIAEWLNSLGITAFILTYRLPGEGHAQRSEVPLQDAQRALRLVRANAAAWGLAPDRIGIMGCSAGGHVAGSLATQYARLTYAPRDAADQCSPRPDFVSLLYPVLSMDAAIAHPGSRDKLLGEAPTAEAEREWSCEEQVSADIGPVFIQHPADDASVPVQNSLRFHAALLREKISVALHVYESGGHGHGIRLARGKPVEGWTALFADWLRRHHYC